MSSSYRIDRRAVLLSLASAAIGATTVRADSHVPKKPDRLIVNASGGEMGQAVEEAYGKVFTGNTGIPVQMSSPHDLGKLRAMVQTKNVEWDVTEIGGGEARLAASMGLLEPIDDEVVDRSAYPLEARDPHLLTTSVYSTILAYRTDVFKGNTPKSWADFWDVEKFPGGRSLANSPIDNLEFALIADGVDPKNLYPLDIDRAFKKLDKIRKHITAWWSSGAQHVQFLVDKEVALSSAWNGRIFNAVGKGSPIGIAWDGSSIHQAYFGIPKGANHTYWSQQFLAAMTDPIAQATFANKFVSPGLNPKSVEHIDPKVLDYLPTSPENLKVAYWMDDLWWSQHTAEVKERWQRWMLG
ncbi:ABC transporter substrate-binding protein [Microvirga sp. M2]|uniref:ABC transporter substrate-binding protein n=1 Tax=Microvirga sp. M2 TaxID=3073270 RepID=UPI0039C097D3